MVWRDGVTERRQLFYCCIYDQQPKILYSFSASFSLSFSFSRFASDHFLELGILKIAQKKGGFSFVFEGQKTAQGHYKDGTPRASPHGNKKAPGGKERVYARRLSLVSLRSAWLMVPEHRAHTTASPAFLYTTLR